MNRVLPRKRSRLAAALFTFIITSVLIFGIFGVSSAQTTVPCDANALIAAIAAANATPDAETLNLTAGCTYSYDQTNNVTDGNNALPSIVGQLTINGNGATITRSGGTLRFFHVPLGSTLSLNNFTITNGSVIGGQFDNLGRGGAIFNRGTVTLTGMTFSANTAANVGGAIMNFNGTLNIFGSLFQANRTTYATGTRFSAGGAIGNDGAAGVITINNSAFINNISEGWAQYTGGGAIINYSGTVNVSNTTFYGNFSHREGGAMAQYTSGTANFTNITAVNNGGVTNGGGIVIIAGSSTFRNSIIANNYLDEAVFNTHLAASGTWGIVWPDTFDPTAGPDIDGIMNSQGYNIVTVHTKKLPPGFNTHYPHATDIGPGVDPEVGGLTSPGPHLPVVPGGPAVDKIPLANCSASDQLGQPRAAAVEGGPVLCDIGAFEYQIPVIPTPIPPPVVVAAATQAPSLVDVNVAFCSDLNGTIHEIVRVSASGVAWGIHCRILAENNAFTRSPAEIGVQSVLNMGVIHAVDVFNAGDAAFLPITVCLEGVGDLVFLDAAGIPRVPQALQAVHANGFTCANLTTEGTLVLVQSSGLAPAASVQVSAPQTAAQAAPSVVTLTDCRVTTTNILNLRADASMNGAVITQVPYNLTLHATERQGEWIKVIFESGQGFLNVGYLELAGSCG